MDMRKTETRNDRRRSRNREALLNAAEQLMIEKGPGVATIQEITDRADVALGTFYSYFDSKEEISTSVVKSILTRVAQQIRAVTDTFSDTAQAFAYGVRTVMEIAVTDQRWRRLLAQPDVVADVWTEAFGPFGKVDIRRAATAKRYKVGDIDLVWVQAIWAIVAVCVSIVRGEWETKDVDRILDEATVNILCMVGVDRTAAKKIVARPRVPLKSI